MDDLLVLESKTGQGFNEKVLERGIPILKKNLKIYLISKSGSNSRPLILKKVNQNQILVIILKQVKKMIKFLIKL